MPNNVQGALGVQQNKDFFHLHLGYRATHWGFGEGGEKKKDERKTSFKGFTSWKKTLKIF